MKDEDAGGDEDEEVEDDSANGGDDEEEAEGPSDIITNGGKLLALLGSEDAMFSVFNPINGLIPAFNEEELPKARALLKALWGATHGDLDKAYAEYTKSTRKKTLPLMTKYAAFAHNLGKRSGAIKCLHDYYMTEAAYTLGMLVEGDEWRVQTESCLAAQGTALQHGAFYRHQLAIKSN